MIHMFLLLTSTNGSRVYIKYKTGRMTPYSDVKQNVYPSLETFSAFIYIHQDT